MCIVLVRVSVEALICLLYSCASSLRRGGLPTVPVSEVAPPSLVAPATYYGNFSRSQGRDHGNGNVPLTRAILSQYPRVPNVFRTATLGTCSGTCSNGVDLPFLHPGSSGSRMMLLDFGLNEMQYVGITSRLPVNRMKPHTRPVCPKTSGPARPTRRVAVTVSSPLALSHRAPCCAAP